MKTLTIWIIKAYQKSVSPLLGGSCRYYPTCSQYSIEAVSKYGTLKGVFMGLMRIAKCNQFFKGGLDPVK